MYLNFFNTEGNTHKIFKNIRKIKELKMYTNICPGALTIFTQLVFILVKLSIFQKLHKSQIYTRPLGSDLSQGEGRKSWEPQLALENHYFLKKKQFLTFLSFLISLKIHDTIILIKTLISQSCLLQRTAERTLISFMNI